MYGLFILEYTINKRTHISPLRHLYEHTIYFHISDSSQMPARSNYDTVDTNF